MIYRPAYCLPTPTSSPQGQVECPTSTAKTDKNELRARPYLHPPKEHEVKRQGGKDQDVQFVAHWRFPGRENPAGAGFVCFGTCSAWSQLQGAAHVLERHRGDDHGEHGPADGADVFTRRVQRAGSFGRNSGIGLLNGQQAGCSSGAEGAAQGLDVLHGLIPHCFRTFFRTRKPNTTANNTIASPCSSVTCSQDSAAP